MNSVAHVRDIEVQEKAEFVTGESQIRQELGTVYRQYIHNRFDFNDETLLNNEVDAVSG